MPATGRGFRWMARKWRMLGSSHTWELPWTRRVEEVETLRTGCRQKARGAFQRLGKVWAARGIGRGIKTLVWPVLLYGCETWKITKADERRLNSFQCQCLRRILRIRWQQRISNNRVVEMVDINNISCEVRRRRWNWLGYVLRREDENDCFTALGWTPEGRRTRGRPKTTWRRTVEKERDKAGWKSWNVAKAAARNRE